MRTKSITMRLSVLGICAIAVVGLVACGDDDESGGGGSGESYDFAIVPVLDDPFFRAVYVGAQEEAEKIEAETGAEIDVEFVSAGEVDPAEQVAAVNSLVTKGVDGFGIAPADAEALVDPVSDASEADIPAVAYNLEIADRSVVISSILTDTLGSGVMGGEYMCEQLGDNASGSVFIGEAHAGNPTLQARWDGFKQGLAEGCPNVKVEEDIIGCEPAEAVSAVKSVLARSSDLRGFFADSQCTATSMVKAAGKGAELVTVAYDATPVEVEFLEDGKVAALIAQKGAKQGALTIRYLYQSVTGDEVPSETTTGTALMTQENLSETEEFAYASTEE